MRDPHTARCSETTMAAHASGLKGLALALTLSAPGSALANGTAVVAVGADPGHLNPAVSTAGPLHAVAAPIFQGLVRLGEDGNAEPDLAESWAVSADGLLVRFTLRAGSRWHDGHPVTADDVVFTFTEALFRWHARARAGLAPAVQSIEAEDARTVLFRLRRPHPALLAQLDVTEAPILPRHVFGDAELPRHPANLRPIGSGAFRFESHRRDDQVVLRRHRPDGERLDRLVFRVIPDATTQANALLAGEVDMIRSVAPADVARLAARGMVVASTRQGAGGSNCTMTLAFNLQRPLPGDRSVRATLDRAIDRPALLERVALGLGRAALAPLHSGTGFAATDVAPPPATGLAPVGATLELAHFPAVTRWAELIRAQAAQAGVALRLRALDPAAFAEAVFTRRDFDLALISYCQGADPEIGFRRLAHSASIGPVPFSNAAHISDPALDAALDAAATATDRAARAAAYREVQRLLLAERPYLFLVETDFALAWRPELTGVAPWSAVPLDAARRTR
jgi:peptide/nickel transport system substrate-binding protein